MTMSLVNFLLLVTLIVMQGLVIRRSAVAVTVARDAANAAATAAVEAVKAAFAAGMALQRLEALNDRLESMGGKTLRATARMEDAADVVASNLAGDKTRAKDRMHDEDYSPGAAADVYAATNDED